MKIYIYLILIIFSYINHAQTWQEIDSLVYELSDINPDSAIVLGNKALSGCLLDKTKNSVEYAVCLDHIAWAYKNKDNFIVSDSLYTIAKQTMENLNKKETEQYADIISNFGVSYFTQARYKEALLLLQECRKIRAKILGTEHLDYAISCSNLALLYQAQSRYSEAESLFLETMYIREKLLGKENAEYSKVCNNLALLYKNQGQYSKAEILYQQSRKIDAKITGKESVDYATTCSNLANLYQSMGNYQMAETLLKEAMQIDGKVLGKKHINYAYDCNNIGLLYIIEGKYNQAEALFKEGKEIISSKLGVNHPSYATLYGGLAKVYQNQKRYDESEKIFKEIQKIYEEKFGTLHPLYANSCHNLALLYQKQGKYSKAESLFIHTLKIREKQLSKSHPDYAHSCASLASLYTKAGNYDKALPLYREMNATKLKEIQFNFRTLSEVEKEKYIQFNIQPYFNQFQCYVLETYSSNPTLTEDSYNLVIQTKGMLLQSAEKIKNRILKSKNEDLINLYVEWLETKNKYNKYQSFTNKQRIEKKIDLDSIAYRANEIEKEINRRSEDFAHIYSPQMIDWKAIQNKLKKDQAAVEIVKLNLEKTDNYSDSTVYIALIIRKESKYPDCVVLSYGNMLEKEFYINYRRSIKNKIYDSLSYNAYWKPILDKLKYINTVFFSPDGVYHQINLTVLQNPETQKYVFDEVQIINVTNTKDILEQYKFVSKNNYLIGNPKFNLELDTKNNQKPIEQRSIDNINQLEGAEKEVKQISTFLPNTTIVLGADATEEYMKSIKNPRILHIATHGYFKKEKYQTSTQAMLNAGLLFAGAADYDRMEIRPFEKEDGKLTAFEVMNMELDSTELVVLSACETGLGQASKEGVYGLQRAFKVAGAKYIIMSLWKVSDDATQLLMTKFYENWQKKGMDKRKAFETAQKEIRKQYKEPYYWGAFVMIE